MMKNRLPPSDAPAFREVTLREGQQAMINGALVTAIRDSTFCVNAGASVIASRPPAQRHADVLPAHELYYAALSAAGSQTALDQSRERLLGLLAETVAHHRTREAQELCSSFAVGLVGGDVDAMLEAARRLAECEAGPVRRVIPTPRAA